MTSLLLKLPWFISTPSVLAVAALFAWLAYAFTGDYFNETCLNERNPLTGEFAPSNCGEGAKVAKRLGEAGEPGRTPAPASGETGEVAASGVFQDGDPGHQGSGRAELQRLAGGRLNLLLSDFSVTNGPDLFVVLSESASGQYSGGDLVLDPQLKANNGSQNYEIPTGTELGRYRSVIIWCRQFKVTFAYAALTPAGPAGQVNAEPTAAQTPSAAGNATATPSAQGTASPSSGTAAASTPVASASPPPSPTPTAAARPSPAASPTTPTPDQAVGVLLRGQFRDGAPGHTGKGTAEVQRLANGSLNAFLSNFSVTNGPDLFVVLSLSSEGDYSSGDLILEPKLKANNGNQNYVIPPGTDLSRYRTLVIWCKSFDVTFAYAVLGGAQ